MGLSERMRFTDEPVDLTALRLRLRSKSGYFRLLSSGPYAICWCEIATKAAQWRDLIGGAPPVDEAPGDCSAPADYDDPAADPTTLCYQWVDFANWEGDNTFRHSRISDYSIPPWGNVTGTYYLRITGPRWVAVKPLNYPTGDQLDQIQYGSTDSGFTFYNETNPQYKYIFLPANETQEVVLFTNNYSSDIKYRIAGALP